MEYLKKVRTGPADHGPAIYTGVPPLPEGVLVYGLLKTGWIYVCLFVCMLSGYLLFNGTSVGVLGYFQKSGDQEDGSGDQN